MKKLATLALLALPWIWDEYAPPSARADDDQRPAVVLVGGYSSGALLPPAIKAYFRPQGVHPYLIHAPEVLPIPPSFAPSFVRGDYDAHISETQVGKAATEIRRILRVKNLQLHAVMIGYEGAVEFGDALGADLARDHDIRTNGIRRSRARRSKDFMMQAIAPLRTPLQISANDPAAGAAWAHTHLFSRADRAVVKPESSGGSDSVFYPTTPAAVEEAVREILGGTTEYSQANLAAIVQEYLAGPEYAVNVSVTVIDGRPVHIISDIFRYNKRPGPNGNDLYFYDELVHLEDLPPGLAEYVFAAMEKLEIHVGSVHAEVKYVNGEWVLVEIAARAMGSQGPALTKRVLGHSQTELEVLAHLDPQAFAAHHARQGYHLPPGKKMVLYSLMAPAPNLWFSKDAHRLLRRLRSHIRHKLKDGMLPQTVHLPSSPGDVWLFGDTADVEADIRELVRLEQGELFRKRPLCSWYLRTRQALRTMP